MKKLILLFTYLLPLMVFGQAVTLEGPNESCEGAQDAWTMTVNDDCICSLDIFAFNGVECDSGQSSFTLDSPFPPNGPAGCENQFQTGFPLPFDMCWESLTGVICVTPIFCDGTKGRSSCQLVTEGENCNESCNDGILNGDEFTVDCGPSCECDCEADNLKVKGGFPGYMEICTGNSWTGVSVTPGFYNYQWTVTGGTNASIFNGGGSSAMLSVSNAYSFQTFIVTITAQDCNGELHMTSQSYVAIPCNGWGFAEQDNPEEAPDGYNELPIKIHPNPGTKNQEITVTGLSKNFEFTAFDILDLSGKVFQSGVLRTDESRIQLTDKLQTGVYFIRFTQGDNSTRVKKIMIRD